MSRLLFSNDDILVINPKLAKLIGLNEAIILQQIHYWIDNKGCKGVHSKGRKWIYNTVSQWQEQFPFLSPSTIKRTMLELRNLDLIFVEQLSENGRDTTNYYSVNYEKLDSLEMGQSEQPREVNLNSLGGSNWSPPNRTETTTETTGKKPRASLADDGGEHFKTFWSAYPKKAGKDAAKKAFVKRKFDEQAFEKVMAALNEQKASEQWVKDAGQFIPHPATWLNQGRFDDELMGGGQQASSAFSGAI